MARPRYDDWNFMGESLENTSTYGSAFRIRHLTVLLTASCLILFVLGLVCAYSASYPTAIAEGRSHYYYLTRQIIFAAVGLVTGLIAYFIPDAVFRLLTPAVMFGSLAAQIVNIFLKNSYMTYESIFALMVLSIVMYLSLYFANRGNHLSRLRELVFPMLFSVIFVFLTAVQQNIMYLVLFLGMVIVMFAVGGVGLGGVILLFLYSAVPAICWIITDRQKVSFILNYFVPGLDSAEQAAQVLLRQQSIASGGWFGKGLGMGVFKLQGIEDISSYCILCNIVEELGFAGIVAIFILFLIIAYCGYRCSYYSRNTNLHYSNLSAGLTTILVWQFLVNVCSVLGIIPTSVISLPFFSVGSNIAVVILECALLLRCLKRGFLPESSSTDVIVSVDGGVNAENAVEGMTGYVEKEEN